MVRTEAAHRGVDLGGTVAVLSADICGSHSIERLNCEYSPESHLMRILASDATDGE